VGEKLGACFFAVRPIGGRCAEVRGLGDLFDLLGDSGGWELSWDAKIGESVVVRAEWVVELVGNSVKGTGEAGCFIVWEGYPVGCGCRVVRDF
jgi:hypothetical protein